jgi:ribosomal protein L29
MKTNEKKDLHQKTIIELEKMLNDMRIELINARLEHSRGKLKNPRLITILRRNIACVSTVLHGKELAHDKNI